MLFTTVDKEPKKRTRPVSVDQKTSFVRFLLSRSVSWSNLYLPSGGVGLRVDSAVYPGYTIPPYYDSMIAKIIVHGENRFDALMKMQRALYELEIEGVVTNADFQLDLISDRRVIAGDYDTSFLMETFLPHYQEKE